MKSLICLCFLLFLTVCYSLPQFPVDDFSKCHLCEWTTAYAAAYDDVHDQEETVKYMHGLCGQLDEHQKEACNQFVEKNIQEIYVYTKEHKSQDEICGVHLLGYCTHKTASHFVVEKKPFDHIPQGSDTELVSEIEIKDSDITGKILQIELEMILAHNNGRDLTVALKHGDDIVTILEKPDCGPGGHLWVVVSDDGREPLQDSCSPASATEATMFKHMRTRPLEGIFKPKMPLEVFQNQTPKGKWSLIIKDSEVNDWQGVLNSWKLHFWGVTINQKEALSTKKTEMSGKGLTVAKTKTANQFLITPRDQFGNALNIDNLSFSPSMECGVSKSPTKPVPTAANCPANGRNFQCSDNVQLRSWLSHTQMGGTSSTRGNDIWHWKDPQTGREYALVGQTIGTAVVDVTDPDNAVYLGRINRPPGVSSSSWRDLKTFQNHVYIVSEASGSGMQVFDLTRLRGKTTPSDMEADLNWKGGSRTLSNTHNIFINEDTGFAYLVGATGSSCGGIYIVSLQNPKSPQFVTCHSPRYTHDIECIVYDGPDPDYQGREICYCYDAGYGMTIKDVTNKGNIQTLGVFSYSGKSYCHQGWASNDRSFVLMNDELGPDGRTYVVDVSDLDNPKCQNPNNCYYFHGDVGANSAQHNNYIRDGYVYQSNYRAGVRVLDLSNKNALSLHGYLETSNYDPNTGGFNGQWSLSPWMSSIIANDIENGLFVLNVNTDDFQIGIDEPSINFCGDEDEKTVIVEIRNFGKDESPIYLGADKLEGIEVSFNRAYTMGGKVEMSVRINRDLLSDGTHSELKVFAKKGEKLVHQSFVVNFFKQDPNFRVVDVTKLNNGSYQITYSVDKAGVYPMHVYLGETEISDPVFVSVDGGWASESNEDEGESQRWIHSSMTWNYLVGFQIALVSLLVLAVVIKRMRARRSASYANMNNVKSIQVENI